MSRSSMRRGISCVVGVSALTLALAVAPGTAGASTGTGLSGTITQATDGAAATNVCAEIYAPSNTNQPVASGCSDTIGHYSVTGLSAGQYLVQFIDGDTIRHDVPQWYNNQPSASSGNFVTVTAGADTANINAVMAAGGAISGTITDASTHLPIPNECVTVYDANVQQVQQAGGVANSYNLCTDTSGVYTTGGLAAGNYTVGFNTTAYGYTPDSNHVPQWYNNQPDQAHADPVTVTTGVVTSSVDAALQPGVAVSGTVTDANGPVAGVAVEFFPSTGNSSVGYAYTQSDGTYTSSVPPGTYTIEFVTNSATTDASQWYNNQPDFAHADTLTVTAGQPRTGVDATLSAGGSISGTVADSAGTAVQGISVSACPSAGGSCLY
jgi:hypothetical protein